VVGPGFAQPNTGASITRENSGNGALRTRGSEQGERKNNAGQMTDAQQAGDSPRITVSAECERSFRSCFRTPQNA
jgi:hypothetical protein